MNTNFYITKNFWEYAVHSRSYKAMSNILRLCAKYLIFMRISLSYRISLFAGLSVDTSLCLLSFYYCCRVRGKLSTKWLFRFASWRENIQMEITAFVTELELCNYFYSPCSQLFKSLSYIHSISAYRKGTDSATSKQKFETFYLVLTSDWKKNMKLLPAQFFSVPTQKMISLNYWTADFGRIWDILNDLFIESE